MQQMRDANGTPLIECIVNLADATRRHEKQAGHLLMSHVQVMELADATKCRLEQASQLGILQRKAADVVSWIGHEENVLHATLAIPTSLQEAERIQEEHKEFQYAVDVCYMISVQSSLQRANTSATAIRDKAEQMLATEHYDPQRVRALVEDVLQRWRRLFGLAEERHKLLTAAVTYYKMLKQVLRFSC